MTLRLSSVLLILLGALSADSRAENHESSADTAVAFDQAKVALKFLGEKWQRGITCMAQSGPEGFKSKFCSDPDLKKTHAWAHLQELLDERLKKKTEEVRARLAGDPSKLKPSDRVALQIAKELQADCEKSKNDPNSHIQKSKELIVKGARLDAVPSLKEFPEKWDLLTEAQRVLLLRSPLFSVSPLGYFELEYEKGLGSRAGILEAYLELLKLHPELAKETDPKLPEKIDRLIATARELRRRIIKDEFFKDPLLMKKLAFDSFSHSEEQAFESFLAAENIQAADIPPEFKSYLHDLSGLTKDVVARFKKFRGDLDFELPLFQDDLVLSDLRRLYPDSEAIPKNQDFEALDLEVKPTVFPEGPKLQWSRHPFLTLEALYQDFKIEPIKAKKFWHQIEKIQNFPFDDFQKKMALALLSPQFAEDVRQVTREFSLIDAQIVEFVSKLKDQDSISHWNCTYIEDVAREHAGRLLSTELQAARDGNSKAASWEKEWVNSSKAAMKGGVMQMGIPLPEQTRVLQHLDQLGRRELPGDPARLEEVSEVYLSAEPEVRKAKPDWTPQERRTKLVSAIREPESFAVQWSQQWGLNAYYVQSYPVLSSEGHVVYRGGYLAIEPGFLIPEAQSEHRLFSEMILYHEMGHSLDPVSNGEAEKMWGPVAMTRVAKVKECLLSYSRDPMKVSEDWADLWAAEAMVGRLKTLKGEGAALEKARLFRDMAGWACQSDMKHEEHSSGGDRALTFFSHPDLREELKKIMPIEGELSGKGQCAKDLRS